MTRRLPDFIWAFSVLLMVMAGASSWRMVELTPDVGSRVLTLNGFEIYPVLAVILLVQVLAKIIGYLVSPLAQRILAAVMVPATAVLIGPLFFSPESFSQSILAEQIADLTGISGQASQLALISSASETLWQLVLQLVMVVNLGALLSMVFSKQARGSNRKDLEHVEELWE